MLKYNKVQTVSVVIALISDKIIIYTLTSHRHHRRHLYTAVTQLNSHLHRQQAGVEIFSK